MDAVCLHTSDSHVDWMGQQCDEHREVWMTAELLLSIAGAPGSTTGTCTEITGSGYTVSWMEEAGEADYVGYVDQACRFKCYNLLMDTVETYGQLELILSSFEKQLPASVKRVIKDAIERNRNTPGDDLLECM